MVPVVVLRDGQVRRWRDGVARRPQGEFTIRRLPEPHGSYWHAIPRDEEYDDNPGKHIVTLEDLRDASELVLDVVIDPPPESDISRLVTAIEKHGGVRRYKVELSSLHGDVCGGVAEAFTLSEAIDQIRIRFRASQLHTVCLARPALPGDCLACIGTDVSPENGACPSCGLSRERQTNKMYGLSE